MAIRGIMKKSSKISLLIFMLLFGMACNLTNLANNAKSNGSISPTTESGSSSNLILETDSCFDQNSIPSNYRKVDINVDQQSPQFADFSKLLKDTFPNATNIKAEAYKSADNESYISCTKLSPLNKIEKVSFDFLVKQPENLMQFLNDTEFTFTDSTLAPEYENLGDSRAILHISAGSNKNSNAEILAVRFNDTVELYTFVYSNIGDQLDVFSKFISTLQ